jgi:hypothetical protein
MGHDTLFDAVGPTICCTSTAVSPEGSAPLYNDLPRRRRTPATRDGLMQETLLRLLLSGEGQSLTAELDRGRDLRPERTDLADVRALGERKVQRLVGDRATI